MFQTILQSLKCTTGHRHTPRHCYSLVIFHHYIVTIELWDIFHINPLIFSPQSSAVITVEQGCPILSGTGWCGCRFSHQLSRSHTSESHDQSIKPIESDVNNIVHARYHIIIKHWYRTRVNQYGKVVSKSAWHAESARNDPQAESWMRCCQGLIIDHLAKWKQLQSLLCLHEEGLRNNLRAT